MFDILVAGNWERDGIADHMVEPFRYYKRKFVTHCKTRIEMRPANTLAELFTVLKETHADVAFITTDWKNTLDDTIAFFKNIHAWKNKPKIVYLDYFDQSSSPFFGILPYIDCYVKKQLYKNLADYRKDYIGGYIVTDFISRHYQLPANDWNFGSYLPEDQEEKVLPGWNLATRQQIRRSLIFSKWKRRLPFSIHKDIDVHCRVSLGDENKSWYYHRHRLESLKALEPLRQHYNVVSSLNDDTILGAKKFNQEIARSHIGFSPFGYGEVTYRDYSCITSGTLLLKPDMSHLVTYPDIFHDLETYVSVKWDLSDIEDKCHYYLKHPQEASTIINNAHDTFEDYFKYKRDYQQVKRVLAKVLPEFPKDTTSSSV
jgi:hypothetical protein